jgi:IS30 family transposase
VAWSPEQISRRLPIDFPEDASMRISHEAIYQALYVQGRGALKRELTACLRTGRALRVPQARTRARGKNFITPEVMLSERPAEAADRAVPGHWEGDLILGLDKSAIGTLVERSTRYTMLLHLPPITRTRRRGKNFIRGLRRHRAGTGRRWPGTAPRRCATRSLPSSATCRPSCGDR